MKQMNEKMWDLKKVADKILQEVKELRKNFFVKDSVFCDRVLMGLSGSLYSTFKSINSELLGRYSHDLAKADEKKPVEIQLGIYPSSNYTPSENTIRLNIISTRSALLFLASKYQYTPEPFDISKVTNKAYVKNILGLLAHEADRFVFEFSEQRLVGTIIHELTHYLDDVLHNNIIPKIAKMDKQDINYPKIPRYQLRYTGAEINSLMRNIKSAKKHFPKKKWKTLTFEDLCHHVPNMSGLYQMFRTYPELLAIWKKKVLTRMNREGLLGANMGKVRVYESSGIQGILEIGSFKSL